MVEVVLLRFRPEEENNKSLLLILLFRVSLERLLSSLLLLLLILLLLPLSVLIVVVLASLPIKTVQQLAVDNLLVLRGTLHLLKFNETSVVVVPLSIDHRMLLIFFFK